MVHRNLLHRPQHDIKSSRTPAVPSARSSHAARPGTAEATETRRAQRDALRPEHQLWLLYKLGALRKSLDGKKKSIPLLRGGKRWGEGQVKTRSLTDSWGPFQHMFWDYIIKNAKDQLKDSSNTWARKDLPKNTQLNICKAIPVENNSNLLCFHQQVNVFKE